MLIKDGEKSIGIRHGVVDVPYVFMVAIIGLRMDSSYSVKVPFRLVDIIFIAISLISVYVVVGRKVIILHDISLEVD